MIVNLEDKKIKRLNHNLKILEDGQGGLLEVLYHEKKFMFLTLKIGK